MKVAGIATVLGDDIDTDIIFPGRYLAVLRPRGTGHAICSSRWVRLCGSRSSPAGSSWRGGTSVAAPRASTPSPR